MLLRGLPKFNMKGGRAADISFASSGGGNWWDAASKIDIDLVGNRAWTLADGEVAVDTLLGSDPNTENGWGTTTYNTDYLTADGYVYSGSDPPALIGAALAAVVSSATIRIVSAYVSADSNTAFALMSADGNDEISFQLRTNGFALASSFNGSLDISIPAIANLGPGSRNCMALTITDTRAELAVNGSAAVAAVIDETDRPPGNPLIASIVDTRRFAVVGALRSITIYDALPTTDGLSGKSETGVTNTAPHDITFDWDEGAGVVAGEIAQVQVTDLQPTAQINLTLNTVAVDAEGNPLTWTLTAADAHIDSYFSGNDFRVRFNNETEAPITIPIGDYHFTIRATDPGGLYVEQEFTITVTEVANTAPHDLTVSWAGDGDGNFPVGNFVEGFSAWVATSIGAVDDQSPVTDSDPLVYSLTDDHDGMFAVLVTDGFAGLRYTGVGDLSSAGTYAFTLRATDPDGLYIEQEFTITVTA